MKKYLQIFTPIIFGTIIGLITSKGMNIDYLVKPALMPPKIIFPIAWTIIYILLGTSWHLYNKNKLFNDTKTNIIYYLGLIVNYAWSFIFFSLNLRFFSIIWIILLDILVLLLQIKFFKYNKTSFYLNIPYMIWLVIATYLTISIYILN